MVSSPPPSLYLCLSASNLKLRGIFLSGRERERESEREREREGERERERVRGSASNTITINLWKIEGEK